MYKLDSVQQEPGAERVPAREQITGAKREQREVEQNLATVELSGAAGPGRAGAGGRTAGGAEDAGWAVGGGGSTQIDGPVAEKRWIDADRTRSLACAQEPTDGM
jgi:hypothetical protein